ncbi:MAG TPA: DUF4198 domain-containing protein [Blastocatellia bacterium]
MRYNTEGWNALLAMLSTGAILGHNLWLLASRKNEARLRLEMNTSDLFPLSESAISPDRIAALSLISSRGSLPVKEYQADGTSLVAEVDAPESEVLLAALTLHPREITLGAEKFEHYLLEEDAHDAIAIRQQTGQSGVDGREIYTKYAKAVFQTEGAPDEAFGQVVGHRLEIVPQRNPCALRIGDRLSIQVLFDGAPVAGLRVSGGGEQLENGRYASQARTAETGRAEIEIIGAGRCFVRTHLIRPHAETEIADWESFWASLTFMVND